MRKLSKDNIEGIGIFPGAFNPLHNGHLQIRKIAEEILGYPVVFELSIVNEENYQLDYLDISARVYTLRKSPYFLTKESSIIEKTKLFAALFPNKSIVFIIGMDAWNLIWSEKQGNKIENLKRIFENYNVRFLVFPREGLSNKGYAGARFRITDKRLEIFGDLLNLSD